MSTLKFSIDKNKVNELSELGAYPIHLFSRFPNSVGIQFLIDNGVDINKQDDHGRTALHLLWHDDQPKDEIHKCLRLLLENGANCNIPDNDGSIPLHCATTIDDIEILKLLIQYGSKLDKVDNHGSVPLTYSIYKYTVVKAIKHYSNRFHECMLFLQRCSMEYTTRKRSLTLILCDRTFNNGSIFSELPVDIIKVVFGHVKISLKP